MTNPTAISPNTGRTFVPNERYWMRESDHYVMPRSNSRYEQPEGFIAVRAISETELEFDNGALEKVPANLDPTNPHHVGAAVSHFGKHQVAEHNPSEGRPMPVTTPNAMDDHITRERSLKALAEQGSANTSTGQTQVSESNDELDEEEQNPPATRRSGRRSRNA